MGRKILAGFEVFVGFALILCTFLNGKNTTLNALLGVDVNVINGVILAAIFYVIKAIVEITIASAETRTVTFLQKFLLYFELLTGFTLVLTGLCDGRETMIETYFEAELIANHGVVVLGVLFASKSIAQLILDDEGVPEGG